MQIWATAMWTRPSGACDLEQRRLIKCNDKLANSTQAWIAWSRMCNNVVLNLMGQSSANVGKHIQDKNQGKDYLVTTAQLQLLMVNEVV